MFVTTGCDDGEFVVCGVGKLRMLAIEKFDIFPELILTVYIFLFYFFLFQPISAKNASHYSVCAS